MRAARVGSGVLLAGALALALLGGVADSPARPTALPAPGPPAGAPPVIVALGDSTLSGEGAGDYTPDTSGAGGDWCHRAPDAEIHRTRIPGVATTVNLACSGADTAQVGLGTAVHYTEPSQTAQLATIAAVDRVVAVVVAVGANDDPHFGQTLNDCVHAWADQGSCSAGLDEQWQQRINTMVPKVVRVLRQIRATMAHAGYDPNSYQLVLQSYAAPIGPDVAPGLLGLAGCPFRQADLAWVRGTAVRTLDAGLRSAAAQAGTRFLDLAGAGLGHEACAGGADRAREWFTRLTVAWRDLRDNARVNHALQESFHPNARGQAAFAACLSEFLATADRAATCLAGSGGALHPAAIVGPG